MSDKGSNGLAPFRLRPWFSERPWGRKSLEPWFKETGTDAPVGEAWLTGPESMVEGGPLQGQTLAEVAERFPRELCGNEHASEFPLLVKLLFPADKLSVQVHPDDAHAQSMGQPRGKTECWYVLEAEPGAAVDLGLKPGVTADDLRRSAADNTMEQLLEQVPVTVGDMIFVDAGTIHAIGPGVTLLETQQTSDTTFRMYDYGRPRELHLEQGLRVLKSETRAGKVSPRQQNGFTRLIEEAYFTVDRFDLSGGELHLQLEGAGCLVGLSGQASVEGISLERAHAVVVPAGREVVVRSTEPVSFVRCSAPPPRP